MSRILTVDNTEEEALNVENFCPDSDIYPGKVENIIEKEQNVESYSQYVDFF